MIPHTNSRQKPHTIIHSKQFSFKNIGSVEGKISFFLKIRDTALSIDNL